MQGIAETNPDVALLDVHLPGGGWAVIKALPEQTYLALSVSDGKDKSTVIAEVPPNA